VVPGIKAVKLLWFPGAHSTSCDIIYTASSFLLSKPVLARLSFSNGQIHTTARQAGIAQTFIRNKVSSSNTTSSRCHNNIQIPPSFFFFPIPGFIYHPWQTRFTTSSTQFFGVFKSDFVILNSTLGIKKSGPPVVAKATIIFFLPKIKLETIPK